MHVKKKLLLIPFTTIAYTIYSAHHQVKNVYTIELGSQQSQPSKFRGRK